MPRRGGDAPDRHMACDFRGAGGDFRVHGANQNRDLVRLLSTLVLRIEPGLPTILSDNLMYRVPAKRIDTFDLEREQAWLPAL
jgi:hypothetical protein